MQGITHKPSHEKILIADLPTLRQAFALASLLILTGVILGYYVNPYFLLMPVVVSGGLMFTSTMGWCPMAFILEHMPWNTDM